MFDLIEVLFALVGIVLLLGAIAWVVGGPIWVFLLQRRVSRLEEDARAAQAAPDRQRARLAEPTETPIEAVEVVPEETPPVQPTPSTASPFQPSPPTSPPTTPQQLAPPSQPAPPQPSASASAEQRLSIEELLAGKWLTWVGAVALVIGVGFFFKYAVDQKWIGETGRVVLGVLAGMAVFVGGAFAMLRYYRFHSQRFIGPVPTLSSPSRRRLAACFWSPSRRWPFRRTSTHKPPRCSACLAG
ncbi:MAG: DUF2339 domain-containing protein [Planctomycetes bacterium]|nr:DUF2339 domain-containing protein [Planctomycetota bacterium]